MYYGKDALSTKPVSVMLIWALLIPATRGHAIQSKVFAMITVPVAGISVAQISIT